MTGKQLSGTSRRRVLQGTGAGLAAMMAGCLGGGDGDGDGDGGGQSGPLGDAGRVHADRLQQRALAGAVR